MPHKIEISDKTYEDLKEFCRLNDLKIGQFADKLIRDGLMIEMYGDVPFTNYRKPVSEAKEIPVTEVFKVMEEKAPQEDIPPEIAQVVQDNWFEMLGEDEKIDQDQEKVQYIEAPPIPEDVIERKKALDKEFLENIGMPAKVINKITKRRLK